MLCARNAIIPIIIDDVVSRKAIKQHIIRFSFDNDNDSDYGTLS